MKKTQIKRQTKHYESVDQWRARGKELFGEDFTKWRFRCPVCGHVQTFQDFVDLGLTKEDACGVFYFSCIGRWMEDTKGTLKNKKSPCDYTCGGLLRLGDFVKNNEGKDICVLWYDEE